MPSVAELKAEAKKRGHKGYSKMKKSELVSLLGKGSGMSQKGAFVRKLKAEGKDIKSKGSRSAPSAPKPQRKVLKPADIDFPEEGAKRKVLKPPPGMALEFDTKPAERRKRLEEIKLKQEERKRKLAERNQKRMEGKLPPLPLASELKAVARQEAKKEAPKKEEPQKKEKSKKQGTFAKAYDDGIFTRDYKYEGKPEALAFPFSEEEIKKNADVFRKYGQRLFVEAYSKKHNKPYYMNLVGRRMWKKPEPYKGSDPRVAKDEYFKTMKDMFKRYLELRK